MKCETTKRITSFAVWFLLRITYHPRFSGRECISDRRPRIYIANGTGRRAAVTMLWALRRNNPFLVMSDRDYCAGHWNRLVSPSRTIRVNADADTIDTGWLHTALRRIKHGESALIFPEKNGAGKLNESFVLLAVLSGAEIVPLYREKVFTPFSKQNIVIGEPIKPDEQAVLSPALLKTVSDSAGAVLRKLGGRKKAVCR